MTPSLFFLCVFAAILELDTTYVFQLTFSRGIIAAPLFSLLTGDIMAGVQIGVFTELLFTDVNPLGGILPPSAVVCSAVALALHVSGTELYITFIFGVVAALVFAIAEKYRRRSRFRFMIYWEQKIVQKPASVNRAVAISLFSSAAINFLILFLFIWGGIPAAKWLAIHLPYQAQIACKFAYMAVPWIGLAALVPEFRLKTR
jgi:mannose/fructose/N-acetylgalactosamine-specific phosphotransferase system component IIC